MIKLLKPMRLWSLRGYSTSTWFYGPGIREVSSSSGYLGLSLSRYCSSTSSTGSGSETGGESSSSKSPAASEEQNIFLKKKYTDTLLLPKTDFPMKIAYEKRNEHEQQIADVNI